MINNSELRTPNSELSRGDIVTLKEDLKAYIEANVKDCPPIFLDYLPEEHERAVQIIEYSASPSPLRFDYGLWARRLQIIVKGMGAKKTENLAHSLYELLNSGLTEEERVIELCADRKVISRPRELPTFIAKEGKASLYGFNVIIHTNRR